MASGGGGAHGRDRVDCGPRGPSPSCARGWLAVPRQYVPATPPLTQKPATQSLTIGQAGLVRGHGRLWGGRGLWGRDRASKAGWGSDHLLLRSRVLLLLLVERSVTQGVGVGGGARVRARGSRAGDEKQPHEGAWPKLRVEQQATPQRTLPGGTERHSSLTPAQAPAHRVTFARLPFEAGGVAPWQMA